VLTRDARRESSHLKFLDLFERGGGLIDLGSSESVGLFVFEVGECRSCALL